MRKLIIVLLLNGISASLLAQAPLYPRLQAIADSITRYKALKMLELAQDTIDERYFSREAYNYFFDNFFTQMQYSRETFTDGNSAALKIDDKTTKLDLTLSHKANNVIFSVGTSLNVSDKSGVLFTGDKPTAGTEVFGSFSYLLSSQRKLGFRGEHMESNWRKRKYLLDSIEMVHVTKALRQAGKLHADSIWSEQAIIRFPDSIQLLSGRIARLLEESTRQLPGDLLAKAKIDSAMAVLKAKVELFNDSIFGAQEKLFKTKEDLVKLDNGVGFEEDMVGAIIDAADKRSIQMQLETPGVTTFKLKWLTGGIRYRRDNYSTYDSTLLFVNRIGEKPFDKWTLNGSINFLWQKTEAWRKFQGRTFIGSFYMNLSWSLVRSSSYDRIKESDITLIHTRSQNDSIYEFSKPGKLKDISGQVFTKTWVHNPSMTITPIFGKQQFIGLNLTTSGEFDRGSKPVFNFRSGILFRFKDSDKEKSFINFELFLNFKDMSDVAKSGKSVWQNKQLGVSANLPFEKVFFR